VELLAVLVVIGLLAALLLPAVQQAREAARRTQCRSHLHQLGLALHAYHETYRMFPRGDMRGLSPFVALLPFVDQQALYEDFRRRNPDDQFSFAYWNNYLSTYNIPLFHCPSDPWGDVPKEGVHVDGTLLLIYSTNYVANFGTGVQTHGYNGLFGVSGDVRAADVVDGLSNTAALSESLIGHGGLELARTIWATPYPLVGADELEQFARLCRATAISAVNGGADKGGAWANASPGISWYNHVLYPNDASCSNGGRIFEGAYSASSMHPAMIHVLAADGHVRAVAAHIDLSVWRAFGSRNGGELFSFPE
jgi:type II secretory pathway pseudopilin PulG